MSSTLHGRGGGERALAQPRPAPYPAGTLPIRGFCIKLPASGVGQPVVGVSDVKHNHSSWSMIHDSMMVFIPPVTPTDMTRCDIRYVTPLDIRLDDNTYYCLLSCCTRGDVQAAASSTQLFLFFEYSVPVAEGCRGRNSTDTHNIININK